MKKWDERATEIAYLLNPAFCGRIIYNAIKVYYEESSKPMEFPLVYLILPLILHKDTRERIKSRNKMQVWIKNNPELLIGLANRVRNLIQITNEAVELLMQSTLIELDNNACILVSEKSKGLSKTKFINKEISECIRASTAVAKWFSKAGTVENIYINWGIRP